MYKYVPVGSEEIFVEGTLIPLEGLTVKNRIGDFDKWVSYGQLKVIQVKESEEIEKTEASDKETEGKLKIKKRV